jgi:hypothetical protein
MRLHLLQIPAHEFAGLPKEEKLFLLRFSHLHNDLRHVQQLVQTAYNGAKKLDGIERDIATHQVVFAVRLWCGFLREAKKTYDSSWIHSDLAKQLGASLGAKTLNAAQKFDEYFDDPRNRICEIRNRFAFHYDRKAIAKELEQINLRDSGYQFVTSDRSGNIFYNTAEAYRTLGIFRAVDVNPAGFNPTAFNPTGLRKLYDEILSVHDNFMTFSQAVLVAIVKKAGPQSTSFTSKSVVDQQKVEPIIFIDEDAIVKKFGRGP